VNKIASEQKSMIEKISSQSDCLTITLWVNGKCGCIVDLDNDCCFRFIEYETSKAHEPLAEKYPYYDQQKTQPIIACGFVGWLLKHKGNIAKGDHSLSFAHEIRKEKQTKLNGVDSTQIYDGYLKSRLEMYREEHKDDPDLFKRDLEKEFYAIHKDQEMLLVKQSEALYDYLPECEVKSIKEYVRYYFEFIDSIAGNMEEIKEIKIMHVASNFKEEDMKSEKEYEYDVVFSFSGENRAYVDKVANILRSKGVNVFYDNFEETNLWGKDLAAYFDHIYNEASRYVIIFVSKSYEEKIWTNHELSMALQRALSQKDEYILPAKFDDTKLRGVSSNIGFIDLRNKSESSFSEIILQKIGVAIANKKINNIRPIDESRGIYEIDTSTGAPPVGNNIQIRSKDGDFSISFAVDTIRERYFRKEDFFDGVMEAHEGLIKKGKITRQGMRDMLELAWKEAHKYDEYYK
jgi:hypothetical protein